MSNPTSNFGWQMPTNTDLVSALPADFEVFGQAVDTSLADLKGGTTGQVLAKASNTNMDFTWIAADPLTILDAKGDLISATAPDTPARLAVGADNTVLTADSSTSTGLKWATPGQSAFTGCILQGSNAIPDSTYTALTFTSELVDTDNFHNNSTNTSRITIPAGKAGKYLVNSSWTWASGANSIKAIRLYKNGAYHTVQVMSNISGQQFAPWFPYMMELAVGDYIEAFVYQEQGGTRTADGHFQIVYLGA
jgi:hypothetical protein